MSLTNPHSFLQRTRAAWPKGAGFRRPLVSLLCLRTQACAGEAPATHVSHLMACAVGDPQWSGRSSCPLLHLLCSLVFFQEEAQLCIH